MDKELRMEIRHLYTHGHYSIRKIANHLKVSRKTVRKALRDDTVTKKVLCKQASKLDPYQEEIKRLLIEYPTMSGIRIFEEIGKQGYTGKTTILNEYLQTLRHKQKEAFFRLRLDPGKQAQVDWGSCGTIMVAGHPRRLSVFAMVLSYSRMLYIEFTLSERIEEFLRCHVNAFAFFGGIPSEVLYDNLKSVVLQRSGSIVRFNSRFLDFAGTYCIHARLCGIAKGNEKGRVESAIKYIKGNFLAGRTFNKGLTDINVQACHWRDTVANVRIHGTTHKHPVELFMHEQSLLGPLSAIEYDTAITVSVRASKDCFVKFETNSYSVPIRYVSQQLTLKALPYTIKIFKDHDLIAAHQREYDKYKTIEDPSHFRGLLLTKKNATALKNREHLIMLGEQALPYMEGLAQAKVNARLHVRKILTYANMYGRTAVLDAINKALQYDAFGAEYIENIILQRRAQDDCTDPVNTLLMNDTTGFGDIVIPVPDLARYDKLAQTDDCTDDTKNNNQKGSDHDQ